MMYKSYVLPPSDTWAWWDAPSVFPVYVGVWVGGHSLSVTAVWITFVLECLAAGALVDFIAVQVMRRRQRRVGLHDKGSMP
jgi:hypothetical protein